MAISKHINMKYLGGSPNLPVVLGDRYYSQDILRDLRFLQDRIGGVVKDGFGVPVFFTGGVVTQGTGDTLNITSVPNAYAKYDVNIVNSFATIPPTITTETLEAVRIVAPGQTNMAITSATLDGVTKNYIKLRYKEVDGATRTRARKGGTISYETTPSYEYVVDSTGPTAYDVCLGVVIGLPSGTFTITDENSDRYVAPGTTVSDLTADMLDDIIKLKSRVEGCEGRLLEDAITLDYLQGRSFNSSNQLVSAFFNRDTEALVETSSNKPAEIMSDNDWNNNWKERDGEPDFKNGFMRPKKQPFMLEIVDEYDLEGVGQTYKCSMKWDATQDCYWMVSNAGAAAIGEITKIHKSMADGKVQVLARYYLPAGAASTQWTGITTNGAYLFFVLQGSSTASKVYKIAINSDGTLGAVGYTKKNGETIDLTNSVAATHTSAATGYYNDIVLWDTDTLMVLNCNTTTVTLISLAVTNLGDRSGTVPNKTGLGNYVGGSESTGRSAVYDGTTLYVRINDNTDDKRFIYKFVTATDIVSNAFIGASGRFETSRNVDHETTGNEGICIGYHGDILEITDTASNGRFISRRALKNALWAENQVAGELKSYASTNPYQPAACMVEYTGGAYYYWTADVGVTADQVDLYRFKPSDGTYKHARCTNQSWTWIYDLTYKSSTDVLYILASDGTNYEVFYGDLSDFVALMGSSYNTGNTISIGTAWGTIASGIGAANTNELNGICYDSDSDVVLLLNKTDEKIDTLSTNGSTWTQGVYDLPAATNTWFGIAYKNGNIFINDQPNAATPVRSYVLKKSLCTTSAWYRAHIYQDPSAVFTTGNQGRKCLDFAGSDLVSINYTSLSFTTMKVLEDPDVMQLHTFMDSNNILLSSNVSCVTAIAERYFDPEDFVDIRDCPDLHYCAVGYGDEGFSELHLDEYLGGKSSTGKDRYDVSKIRARHYKRAANNIIFNASTIGSLVIDHDIIIAGNNYSGGSISVIVDLKSGKATVLDTSTTSGYYYNGTLSERNDAKTTTGTYNPELNISSLLVRKLHARTFFKEDASDYNLENPKTFVSIGTDGGNDVLVIDWDENGNRTPVKVWNNVFNSIYIGRYALFIGPSGKLFGCEYLSGGAMYYSVNPMWQLAADAGFGLAVSGDKEVGSNILGSYAMDISPNSRCWKTPSGTWRHQLVCGTLENSGTGVARLAVVDVENATVENVYYYDSGGSTAIPLCDNYDDCVFSSVWVSAGYTNIAFIKKQRFLSKVSSLLYNGWAYDVAEGNGYGIIGTTERPYYVNINTSTNYGWERYSKDFGLLAHGYVSGLQFFHIRQLIQSCLSQTIEIDVNSPEYYNYTQNAILPTGEKLTARAYNYGSVAYTNGASKNWNTIAGAQGTYYGIERDGTTEGYLVWTIPTGKKRLGVHLIMDDNSGGASITVTDTTTSTILTDWNAKLINTYHAEAATDVHRVIWITLPNSTDTYTVRVAHGGQNNGGAQDYLMISVADAFYDTEELLPARCATDMTVYHSSYPAALHTKTDIDLTAGQTLDTYQIATFTCNGSTDTTFTLSGNDHASGPYQFGVKATLDPTITWLSIHSTILSWGSNATAYDDETVDANGFFTVKFDSAPDAGNVYIKYIPLSDKMYLSRELILPNDGATYVMHVGDYAILDDGIEAI